MCRTLSVDLTPLFQTGCSRNRLGCKSYRSAIFSIYCFGEFSDANTLRTGIRLPVHAYLTSYALSIPFKPIIFLKVGYLATVYMYPALSAGSKLLHLLCYGSAPDTYPVKLLFTHKWTHFFSATAPAIPRVLFDRHTQGSQVHPRTQAFHLFVRTQPTHSAVLYITKENLLLQVRYKLMLSTIRNGLPTVMGGLNNPIPPP